MSSGMYSANQQQFYYDDTSSFPAYSGQQNMPASSTSNAYADPYTYDAFIPSQWNNANIATGMGYADNRPPALTAYNHNCGHQPAYGGRRPSSSMNHTHHPAGYSGSVPRPTTELFTLPRPWNLPPVKLPSISFTSYGIPGVSLNALLKGATKLDNSREKIFEPFGHRQASIAIHWPGYRETGRAMVLKVFNSRGESMTRKDLALELALTIQEYKKRLSPKDEDGKLNRRQLKQDPVYERWSLDKVEDTKLVALHYHNGDWVPDFIVEMKPENRR